MDEKKISLLIVDDEEQFLEGMKKRLELRDFDVTAVNRGEKALEAARRKEIDIALLDLKMPGMDGEETLEALKAEHKHLEIVILTGHGSVDSAVKLTKSGAYSYLQKPCEFDAMIEILLEAYQKRVKNKLEIKQERLDEIMSKATSSSPLGLIRQIKAFYDEESK